MVKIFEYYSALVDSFHQDDRDEYSKRPPILVIGSSYKDSRSRIKNLSFQVFYSCID